MPTKQPMTIYRSLFVDAMRVAWERKALWVFGLFAALLSTGGVCEMSAKGFHRLTAARDMYVGMMNGTFTGAQTFGRYVQNLSGIEPSRVTAAVTLIVVFAALAVVASVVSQGALVAGAGRKAVTDAEAATAGRASFWHLLGLNVLHKAAQTLLILLSALPLFLVVSRTDGASMAGAMLTFAVAFPLTVVISVLFMLASVHAVKTGSHALDSAHHAVTLFRAHWLAAFETGILLFGAVVVAAFAFAAAVALGAVAFAVLVSVTLLIGNPTLFLLVNVLGAGTLVLMVFAFAGATTTFQYAAWVRFYEHAGVKRKIISKIHRVWIGK